MARHTAEHQSARRVHPRLVAAIVTVAVAVSTVTGTGVVWARSGFASPFGAPPPPCATIVTLSIVADTSIAPAVGRVAHAFERDSQGCVMTQVRVQASADTAAEVASGAASMPDVWVPDSEVWLARLSATTAALGRPAPEARIDSIVASTPVVFAAPADRATEFGEVPVGWANLLAGTLPVLLPQPEAFGSSLSALESLAEHAPAEDVRALPATMIALGKSVPANVDDALATAALAADPMLVVTTEQQVVAHNESAAGAELVAMYPTDGISSLDYPLITAAEPDSDAASAIDELAELLTAASDDLGDAGFRPAGGGGELSASGVVRAGLAATVPSDPEVQLTHLRSWSVLTLSSRMLSVIDVSGSMLEPDAATGLRRIDIFQQAAGSALGLLADDVEMGVWVFSTTRVGDQDWEDVVPIARLGAPSQAQAVRDVVASLPARAGGGTGLYDTTLAAVQRLRDGYDPDRVNSVLLFTDGRNDEQSGIDLPTLLAELTRLDDPAKPVPVIMIGIGPDTDLAAMNQIADATGGAAYSAVEPGDLGLVLVDALSQRGCRPNCS